MTKILVVDDEPDVEILIRQKFAKQIKSKEFDFTFAANGVEALKVLSQDETIHIVLTDINMPEMDGLVLLSHLPELKRIFKTVIISAYGDMSNIRKAMNEGACDFITKPIDFRDLEITIINAIQQYDAMQKAAEIQTQLTDLEKEISIASNIQQSIIPHRYDPFPGNQNFEIYGTMIPAKTVGGDFFDFFPLDQNHLGFVIGDVSGKGVPGAFFMAMSRAIFRTIALRSTSPSDCLAEANRMLCIDNDTCMFVTTFYGIYTIDTGVIEVANAGHNPPYLLKANGVLESIARNEGIPLGVLEQTDYVNHSLKLQKGDCLILYTDGVTEAMNPQKQLFTEERLEEMIHTWTPGPLPTLTAHILEGVAKHTEGAPTSDDITLFCLKQLK